MIFIITGAFRKLGFWGSWDFVSTREYIFTTLAGICYFMSFAALMLSTSLAETIFRRIFTDTRSLVEDEEKRLKPIIGELKFAYLEKFHEPLKIKISIDDSNDCNGFAMGHSSIAIYDGALGATTDEELASIIAHEMGHLHHRDGGFYSLILMFESLLSLLLPSNESDQEQKGRSPIIYFVVMALLLLLPLPIGIAFVGFMILMIIYKTTVRKFTWWQEYRADAFAAKLGFKEGLVSFLEKLAPFDQRKESGFFSRYKHSHPPTRERIERLKHN